MKMIMNKEGYYVSTNFEYKCDQCERAAICRLHDSICQLRMITSALNNDGADIEVDVKIDCEHWQSE